MKAWGWKVLNQGGLSHHQLIEQRKTGYWLGDHARKERKARRREGGKANRRGEKALGPFRKQKRSKKHKRRNGYNKPGKRSNTV